MSTRYLLQRIVGRGRNARVWLAHDRERDRQVALKLAAAGSLAAEWQRLCDCQGDGAVRPHQAGQWADGSDFLAMEYAPPAAPEGTPRTVAEAAALVAATAAALAAVHARGWVHRDIKPQHVLGRADGTVVLCDLGIACAKGEAGGSPGTVTGTPRYAAPEQTQGEPATPAADIYSLGVCAFEWLAGRPPFAGETLIEISSQHLRAQPPRLPARAAQWQSLVDAMLNKDPRARPADGASLLRQWRPVLEKAHEFQ